MPAWPSGSTRPGSRSSCSTATSVPSPHAAGSTWSGSTTSPPATPWPITSSSSAAAPWPLPCARTQAPTVAARIAGAREAILDRGLPVPPNFVRLGEPDDPAFARGFVGKGGAEAILCANDDVAARSCGSLETAGVRVPAEVRAVGFDDVRYASMLSVSLTTMR